MIRLKHFARLRYGDAPQRAESDEATWTVPLFGANGRYGTQPAANTAGPCIVLGRNGSAGACHWSDTPAWVADNAYAVDACARGGDLRWLYYVLIISDLPSLVQTTGVPSLPREAVHQLRIPSMPAEQQRRVVRFLDDECARIDELSEEIGAMNACVDAWADARLREALSSGDPSWVPFKYLVGFREGPGIMAADFRDEGVPLLRIRNLVGDAVSLDGCGYLDPDMVSMRWDHFRVREGDLLVSGSARSGAASLVGRGAEGAVPYTGLIRMWPLDPSRLTRDYLMAFLRSAHFLDQVNLEKTGVALQHWGPTHLRRVRMPVVDPSLQKAVVAQTEGARSAQLQSAAEITALQEALTEYRHALIREAVMGRIELESCDPVRMADNLTAVRKGDSPEVLAS